VVPTGTFHRTSVSTRKRVFLNRYFSAVSGLESVPMFIWLTTIR